MFRAVGKAAIVVSLCLMAVDAAPASSKDALERESPRSAVTAFLDTCRNQDYRKGSQYLDLRQLSDSDRTKQGPELARKLDGILNQDSQFSVMNLSSDPEGDPNSADANRVAVVTISQGGQNLTLYLERVTLQDKGPHIWLFSSDTVSAIPNIHISTISSAIGRHLPPFLESEQFLETALWKWIVLVVLAALMVSLSRLLDWMLVRAMKIPTQRFLGSSNLPWLEAVIQPFRVMLCLAVFRIGEGVIDPSAIARLYIGRILSMILAWSIAWCLIRVLALFMDHMELTLDSHQKRASRTMLRLGRRTATATIVIVAILLVLQNWGYNTSTLIAGLGVGGIAVALAAQQTIANVFGGVSLIGDHPIRIGEFGKFGDMEGVVEDIGMRSTRVRTLNRTVVSVPNSNFAGLNLENFSMRDKILFNPTFQIKRSTPDAQVQGLIEGLDKLFASRKDLDPVATPARLVALGSGSYSLEIFCYVRTPDIDEFYKIQTDLLLSINQLFNDCHVELA